MRGSMPLGTTSTRVRGEPEELRPRCAREDSDEAITRAEPGRPAPHPGDPGVGVGPGAPRRELVEHQQLGAVQVRHDGDVRPQARERLVHRGQVVQVRHGDVVEHPGRGEQARPLRHQVLVDRVVEPGHHAVGGPRAVLVGGVHGRGRPQRVGRAQGGVVGDRHHVEARRRTCAASPAPPGGPTEPLTTRGLHREGPSAIARARYRTTWAEPPRGKNIST